MPETIDRVPVTIESLSQKLYPIATDDQTSDQNSDQNSSHQNAKKESPKRNNTEPTNNHAALSSSTLESAPEPTVTPTLSQEDLSTSATTHTSPATTKTNAENAATVHAPPQTAPAPVENNLVTSPPTPTRSTSPKLTQKQLDLASSEVRFCFFFIR